MIPSWNSDGVIPPIRPGAPGHARDRSPYRAPLHAVVDMLGTSTGRLNIIEGLLAFRSQIHEAGINTGFQWLDGSFSENVEMTQGRDPRDVDVVTFIEVPSGETQASLLAKHPSLFDHDYVKHTFKVDSYWDILGEPIEERTIRQICYWHGMWSHRRNGIWKGYVQVDLAADHDALAAGLLTQAKLELGVSS